MKFSVTVSPEDPRFSAIVFTRGIENHLPLISKLGYDAIELHVSDPSKLDSNELRRILDKFGLGISMIGTGSAYAEEGISFLNKNKNYRLLAIDRIKKHIDFFSEYDAKIVIGLIRGNLDNRDKLINSELDLFLDACKECCNYAEKTKTELLIEPINRYETNFINNVREAIDIIEKINSPCLGLLLDTFHMNIEEKSIIRSLEKAGNMLRHLHLSDSNRYSPGLGHLDIPKIIETIIKIGYDQYISFEILPFPTSDQSAKDSIDYIRKILNRQTS